MLAISRQNPLNYVLCNQTVTVYHWDGASAYSKQVFNRAFLDFKKNQNVDKIGSTEANDFLLVIPCEIQPVFAGDKVLLGEGPDIASREEWAALIPAKVPGLVVVKYVDPKYWRGRLVHVEAGG